MSARPSVLVFGSVNVDLVMRVSTLPISGETVLTDDYQPLPGGKGANQALAARRAGADSVFIGAVGDDAHGILALALLAQDGVDLSCIVKTKRNTGCAVVMSMFKLRSPRHSPWARQWQIGGRQLKRSLTAMWLTRWMMWRFSHS